MSICNANLLFILTKQWTNALSDALVRKLYSYWEFFDDQSLIILIIEYLICHITNSAYVTSLQFAKSPNRKERRNKSLTDRNQ